MTLSEESEVTICIGSNCGDREENVASSIAWLSTLLSNFRHSSIYATPDCHGGQRKYMNAVAIGCTRLSVAELDQLCKQRELECGRNAAARAAGDVPVDIDVVVYGNEILRMKDYQSEFFIKGYLQLEHSHSATEI